MAMQCTHIGPTHNIHIHAQPTHLRIQRAQIQHNALIETFLTTTVALQKAPRILHTYTQRH